MKKRTLVIISIVLVLLLVLSVLSWGGRNWNVKCWFGHNYADGICTRCGAEQPDYDKPVDENPAPEQELGNVVIETVSAKGMRLKAVPVALSNDAETYSLTATITPASADDKRVEWTVGWKNANSLWATGKTATEYVTVTPTSEYALTATVACIKDFGEQVIITVKSLDNEEATAQCSVDYIQKITGFTFNMPTIANTENTFTYEIETSDYTLKSDISFNISNKLVLTEAFKQEFKSHFDKYFSQYVIDTSAYLGRRDNNGLFIEDGSEWDFSKGDPDDFYYPDNIVGCFYGFDMQWIDDAYDFGYPTRAFRETCNAISTAHATFEITYSATYNGTVCSSGSKTVEVKFDGEALHIPVTGINLSQGSIIF